MILYFNVTALFLFQQTPLMENSTATFSYEWEYYYDYIDPVIVDESKLKYNKCKYYANEFANIFVLCCIKVTRILHFPFRFNRHIILDIFGCLCGIPLSLFESYV